jgi:hypothetical protein
VANATWTQTLDQTTAVSVYKRYATTAYDLKNQSILSIESISSPQSAPMNLTVFIQYISMVLGPVPEILNYSDIEAYKAGTTRYAVQFGWGVSAQTAQKTPRFLPSVNIKFSKDKAKLRDFPSKKQLSQVALTLEQCSILSPLPIISPPPKKQC